MCPHWFERRAASYPNCYIAVRGLRPISQCAGTRKVGFWPKRQLVRCSDMSGFTEVGALKPTPLMLWTGAPGDRRKVDGVSSLAKFSFVISNIRFLPRKQAAWRDTGIPVTKIRLFHVTC
jgi:hypothetical protein